MKRSVTLAAAAVLMACGGGQPELELSPTPTASVPFIVVENTPQTCDELAPVIVNVSRQLNYLADILDFVKGSIEARPLSDDYVLECTGRAFTTHGRMGVVFYMAETAVTGRVYYGLQYFWLFE